MGILFLSIGIILLLVAVLDILKTVIFINGGGTLSKYLAARIWNLFFFLANKKGSSFILTYAGGSILILMVALWIVLVWAGFSFIVLSDHDSVVDATTLQPASIIGKIYYVGYTITSLGNGDLKSGSDNWRIISNIMGISSMIFTSLSISYILPVLQAVIAKRTLAIYISKLGRTPMAIIKGGWTGKDFSPLYARFDTLESMLLKHSERHLAYPLLHYFHSNRKQSAAPLCLAALDEATTIQEVYQLDKTDKAYHWTILRGALDNYIIMLDSTFTSSTEEAPPFPYENPVKGVVISEEEKKSRLSRFKERRCKLLDLIQKDGWAWDDLLSEEDLKKNPNHGI